MLLEICANSYQSAENAQISGANRVELCIDLSNDGITPSDSLLKKVAKKITIPVFVLIRPRSGNFIYSEIEFEIMKQNIILCKNLGYNGIVSGVLNQDNSIDINRTKELIELSHPMSFTFHRAFDCINKPKEAISQLIEMGADRVLTSGQQKRAEDGIKLLKELKEIGGEKIIILVGGGINSNNAKIFKNEGFEEIHASASIDIEQTRDNSSFGLSPYTVSSVKKIKGILNVISCL